MSSKSFLKGAAILGIAGIIVKIMGAFYRIPLTNMITSEGMGYYQTGYPIYVALLIISTAGIPTAISKLVAEKNAMGDRYGAHRIFKVSFILLFALGIVTSTVLYFGSGVIVGFMKNDGARYSMMAIAPALLFVPIMAAFRGYFQGLQDMVPTAISQIIEQFGRTVVGFLLAYVLLNKFNKELEIVAAGASFGAAAGAITGTLIIIFIYLKRRNKILSEIKGTSHLKQESAGEILSQILAIAVPITIGASILPLMNTIDAAIVMRRLQDIGYSAKVSNDLYGQLTGMAAPLVNLPQIITVSLAVSLVPAISEAKQRRDMALVRENIQMGTRVALLIGLPAALGLVTLSKPIMLLLFPLIPESAVSAAGSLSILGFGVIFLTLVQTFTGILQGLGRPTVPVINLFIGSIFKILATYFLTAIPSLNVRGAAIGTVIAYMVAAILNFFAVKRLSRTKFDFANFVIKPLIAVSAMSISVLFVYRWFADIFGNKLTTVAAIGVGAIIYGLMLLTTGGITKSDFEMLPGGRKIAKILSMIGLLRK
ncbi:putative polysaccharide biosynthesis protein [Crassaminicella profunda]|uniref:putative polysaccharide biosynthesis protein n=1 Tax=Crassaminicella profunda TaxID=1286698 RepID=UPI001CA73985|nr:polysaccharide biosynthesis protein [Crassaminicella profunda]QZY54736.1 polysaccharide biosynthesis protein [Crassaminicella profunda]